MTVVDVASSAGEMPAQLDAPGAPYPPDARRALVTGASSGIGHAIALRLLDEGWQVVGADRTPASAATEADGYRHVEVDLSDPNAVGDLLRVLPMVQALVHAAGFMRVAPLGKLISADGLAMWRVHVQAAESLMNGLVDKLPPGARVVLVGSRTAGGAAGRSQYAASKAALLGMARSWAAELAPRAITVNVVAPGATDTPMLRNPARQDAAPKLPPIGRFVTPSEVAGLTAFLLGPDAGAITGQQIVMCGGGSL